MSDDVIQYQIRMLHQTLVMGDLRTIEVLTIEEVAKLFRMSHGTIIRWMREKVGERSGFRTLGGHRRYFKVYVLMLLERAGVTDPAEREAMIRTAQHEVSVHLKESQGRPNLAGAVLASR